MRLNTVWDDGQYIWHYFTSENEALGAAIPALDNGFPVAGAVVCVTSDGVRGPWRVRVEETGCAFITTRGRCNRRRWAQTPYCIDHDHDIRRVAELTSDAEREQDLLASGFNLYA
jgi:hypothetical protein